MQTCQVVPHQAGKTISGFVHMRIVMLEPDREKHKLLSRRLRFPSGLKHDNSLDPKYTKVCLQESTYFRSCSVNIYDRQSGHIVSFKPFVPHIAPHMTFIFTASTALLIGIKYYFNHFTEPRGKRLN